MAELGVAQLAFCEPQRLKDLLPKYRFLSRFHLLLSLHSRANVDLKGVASEKLWFSQNILN